MESAKPSTREATTYSSVSKVLLFAASHAMRDVLAAQFPGGKEPGGCGRGCVLPDEMRKQLSLLLKLCPAQKLATHRPVGANGPDAPVSGPHSRGEDTCHRSQAGVAQSRRQGLCLNPEPYVWGTAW